jgi:uncharacterized Tic20 family protein
MNAEQERNWAIACHLSSLAWIPLAFLGVGAIPFVNLLAPAAVWLLNKEKSELVDAHGKESLNFQISMTIYGFGVSVVCVVLVFILVLLFMAIGATDGNPLTILLGILSGLGLVFIVCLIGAIALFQIIVAIIAAMKAQDGEFYRYPFNLRLL